jgi:hypothetical protein
MSVSKFFEKMIGIQKQRTLQKQTSYRELLAGIVAGEEPNPVEVERLLAEAQKSIEDLQKDVNAYQRRMALKAQLASLPKLEQELAGLQQQISAADRELEAAEARYDEITAPLRNQYERVKEARSEASSAKQELSNTCKDEVLLAQYIEANNELERLMVASKQQETHAVYLENKAETSRIQSDRELSEADRDLRREQAGMFQKQADSLRASIKAREKEYAEVLKRRDEIEQQMVLW